MKKVGYVMKNIRKYLGINPQIDKSVFIAPSANIIGKVKIGRDTSIWYQSVLRGDVNEIVVGKGTNIQDGTVVHLSEDYGTYIGDNVTIGHSAIIHGCTIKDNVLIGMGACVLDGAVIPKNCIVAARALVTKSKTFDEGTLIIGSPAKSFRKLTDVEIESVTRSALGYIQVAKEHMEENPE